MDFISRTLLLFASISLASQAFSQNPDPIPAPLEAWKTWATWDDDGHRFAPPAFNDVENRTALWPSQLQITANGSNGVFQIAVTAFSEDWLTLPGSSDLWPQEVSIGGQPAVVVERSKRPAIKLPPGLHVVSGEFRWDEMPQRLAIPSQIGILQLTMNGQPVEVPNWDASGFLWLKRARSAEAQREFLEAKVYRVLEDGIPMWLRTEIELSVAGKSREETLGYALPQAGDGWTIASVESKLPVAVDDEGQVKIQVRAGKWTVQIDAFRTDSANTIGYAENIKPIAANEIVGFQAKPEFRLVELEDIQAVDVSQTTFPEKWRHLPVYRWESGQPFRLVEKMRGMGFQKPSGLHVKREFWLDDDGALMTFRDSISGSSQQVWRLDASPGQTLGAARMAGEGQLITRNPATGASGIEVRERKIDIEAVGRIENARQFPASGWQADVDSCSAKLHLPPGWRVFALFGAESAQGDWLTSWTLLDLFLLLVFTLAIGKLWGILPAMVAALGLGLTFHEPGAPLWLWFFLLVPVTILRVVPAGSLRKLVTVWKFAAIAMLMIVLVPFIGKQIQGVLYPQLEPKIETSTDQDSYGLVGELDSFSPLSGLSSSRGSKKMKQILQKSSNLAYDSQAQIQTGPAVPTWTWRSVSFGWRGPVTASEEVRVVLIPPAIQRGITILRVLMLILLAAVLLESKRLLPPMLRGKMPQPPPIPPATTGVLLVAGLLFGGTQDAAAQQFPSEEMLETLRERLLETPDAFPRAAEIPKIKVTLGRRSMEMEAEIHAAALTAVPLPGKLPTWSPVSVTINGEAAESMTRKDGHLWIALEPGIHIVRVEGLLPNVTEWEWTFLLKPRHVSIKAPGWTVTGVKPSGVPEDQVFFAVKTPAIAAEAAYDRKDFTPAVMVERAIEVGLVWQVRTTLKRLSPGGKAVALSIPLLPGEQVLSSNFNVSGRNVQARLGAGQSSVSWESELNFADSVSLTASDTGRWVERWRLIASPVWNVGFGGLPPVYETGSNGLEPVWRPWPGEQATLALSKPQAIPGATVTVRKVELNTNVGLRQRVSNLELNMQASLGQDLILDLPENAEVTALRVGDKRQPVRRDGSKVIIQVKPGEQVVKLEWKTLRPISNREAVDPIVLPVESSNIATSLSLPADRWVLWTSGPLRGPTVRFWSFVLVAIVGAFVLGRIKLSPLGGAAWALLALGLTQVLPVAALIVVGWFFLLAWRGSEHSGKLTLGWFNFLQVMLIIGLIPVTITLLFALHRGLLGTPEMMVRGNNSSATDLRWFAQRTDNALPEASAIAVSIWYYRLLMLAWSLWLAASALKWARWGWEQFSAHGAIFKSPPKIENPMKP